MLRTSEMSGCGVSFGTVRITDVDFADDAVIFAETTEVIAGHSILWARKQSRFDCEFP